MQFLCHCYLCKIIIQILTACLPVVDRSAVRSPEFSGLTVTGHTSLFRDTLPESPNCSSMVRDTLPNSPNCLSLFRETHPDSPNCLSLFRDTFPVSPKCPLLFRDTLPESPKCLLHFGKTLNQAHFCTFYPKKFPFFVMMDVPHLSAAPVCYRQRQECSYRETTVSLFSFSGFPLKTCGNDKMENHFYI